MNLLCFLKNISVIKISPKTVFDHPKRALIMLCSLATTKSNMICTHRDENGKKRIAAVMQLEIRVNYFLHSPF